MIKFWALIYRLTGWYSPWAKAIEYDFVMEVLDNCANSWLYAQDEENLSNKVGMEIGLWQARHGFYREVKWKR